MYTSYINHLEKNQMMTPPTIGLTSSIVNDKLGNITLEDNSSGLFAMNEDNSAIQTKDGVPLEASQFKITSTNTEINNDDTNAVNKSYCDSNYIQKGIKTLTLSSVIWSLQEGQFVSELIKKPSDTENPWAFRIRDDIYQAIVMDRNRVHVNNLSLLGTKHILFNTNYQGLKHQTNYPEGKLTNLVPSTITTAQLTALTTNSLLDNVCPTYQFCQNTYLRKSDAETTYAKTGALGSLIQTASIAWPSGFDTYLTGVKSIITGTCDYITGGRVTTLGEIGTCVKEFSIPSNITGNTKIVDTVFYLSSTKTAQAEHLVAALNTSSTNCMFGALSKGVYMGRMTFDMSGAVDEYWYKFHLSGVFTGSFDKLYIHFYFDDTSISGTASGLTMRMLNQPALNDQTSITIIAI